MSLTVLKIIPLVPDYVPSDIQQEKAKMFLSGVFDLLHTELITTEEIEFVDQGENFESVSCNLCGQDISGEDWQDKMDLAYQSLFKNLNIMTSCQHETSLNDLNYKWPAGFAKFVISISDAQNVPSENELMQLHEILGMRMRVIWARY
jgi:hypothetical protein